MAKGTIRVKTGFKIKYWDLSSRIQRLIVRAKILMKACLELTCCSRTTRTMWPLRLPRSWPFFSSTAVAEAAVMAVPSTATLSNNKFKSSIKRFFCYWLIFEKLQFLLLSKPCNSTKCCALLFGADVSYVNYFMASSNTLFVISDFSHSIFSMSDFCVASMMSCWLCCARGLLLCCCLFWRETAFRPLPCAQFWFENVDLMISTLMRLLGRWVSASAGLLVQRPVGLLAFGVAVEHASTAGTALELLIEWKVWRRWSTMSATTSYLLALFFRHFVWLDAMCIEKLIEALFQCLRLFALPQTKVKLEQPINIEIGPM